MHHLVISPRPSHPQNNDLKLESLFGIMSVTLLGSGCLFTSKASELLKPMSNVSNDQRIMLYWFLNYCIKWLKVHLSLHVSFLIFIKNVWVRVCKESSNVHKKEPFLEHVSILGVQKAGLILSHVSLELLNAKWFFFFSWLQTLSL